MKTSSYNGCFFNVTLIEKTENTWSCVCRIYRESLDKDDSLDENIKPTFGASSERMAYAMGQKHCHDWIDKNV